MSNPAASGWALLFEREYNKGYRDGHDQGWEDCKKKIVEILKHPIQNCDLSWEEIDARFLVKILEL